MTKEEINKFYEFIVKESVASRFFNKAIEPRAVEYRARHNFPGDLEEYFKVIPWQTVFLHAFTWGDNNPQVPLWSDIHVRWYGYIGKHVRKEIGKLNSKTRTI